MAFGFDDITFSKRELGADVHYVTSMLNWFLATMFGALIWMGLGQGLEGMATLLPYLGLLYFSPLAVISLVTWMLTMRKAPKFWKPHWIPVAVVILEYLAVGGHFLYFYWQATPPL